MTGRRRVLAAVQVGGVAAGGVDAIDEADSDARNVVELLDGIPRAYARAQLASAQSVAGDTVSVAEL